MRTPPTSTDRPTRRTLFDRVRGVLIIGVVAGHTIYRFEAQSDLINTLNDAARIVRMPAFFLIAGALLKHRTLRNQFIAVLRHLVPVYVAGIVLKTLIDLNESFRIKRKSGVFQPGWSACLCHPQSMVNVKAATIAGR